MEKMIIIVIILVLSCCKKFEQNNYIIIEKNNFVKIFESNLISNNIFLDYEIEDSSIIDDYIDKYELIADSSDIERIIRIVKAKYGNPTQIIEYETGFNYSWTALDGKTMDLIYYKLTKKFEISIYDFVILFRKLNSYYTDKKIWSDSTISNRYKIIKICENYREQNLIK